MASAREVRAAVRAQMAAQMTARQDAALAVAGAWSRVEKARERVTLAEADAAAAVTTATAVVPLLDLAALAGVPLADLRRLARTPKATTADAIAPSAGPVETHQGQPGPTLPEHDPAA